MNKTNPLKIFLISASITFLWIWIMLTINSANTEKMGLAGIAIMPLFLILIVLSPIMYISWMELYKSYLKFRQPSRSDYDIAESAKKLFMALLFLIVGIFLVITTFDNLFSTSG